MDQDKRIGERHGDLTIVARSSKTANGYLYYYWTRCECGNFKRFRYDQARRANNCGVCKDFRESVVIKALEGLNNE